MKGTTKIKIVFWTHFTVAALSHIFAILIMVGASKLLLASTIFDFWTKGLILGVTFYTAMYAINHVTNQHGFCSLTYLENYLRRCEGMEEVGTFTPRFYKQIAIMYEWLKHKYRDWRK